MERVNLSESILMNLKEGKNLSDDTKEMLDCAQEVSELIAEDPDDEEYMEVLDSYDFTCSAGFSALRDLAKMYPGKSKRAEEFIKTVKDGKAKMKEDKWKNEDGYADIFEYLDIGDLDIIDYLTDYAN